MHTDTTIDAWAECIADGDGLGAYPVVEYRDGEAVAVEVCTSWGVSKLTTNVDHLCAAVETASIDDVGAGGPLAARLRPLTPLSVGLRYAWLDSITAGRLRQLDTERMIDAELSRCETNPCPPSPPNRSRPTKTAIRSVRSR